MPREQNYAVCVRIKHFNKSKTRGSYRHNLRLGKIPKYVDQDRTELNSIILHPPKPSDCLTITEQLRSRSDKQRKMRSDAAITSETLVTFGADVQRFVNELSIERQNSMYSEIVEAVRERIGASLLGLVVHRDESAPHAHATFSSFSEFGTPLSKICTPSVLSEIQDLVNEVGQKHVPQIQRGVSKKDRIERGDDQSKVVNRSVKQLHEDLPAEIEAAQFELTLTLSKIGESKAKLEQALERQRVAEQKRKDAERKAEDFERLKKRAETYERRAEKAEASLSVLETQKQSLENQIADLQSKHTELSERERRAQQKERELEATQKELNKTSARLDERASSLNSFESTLDGQNEAVGNLLREQQRLEQTNGETSKSLDARESALKSKEAAVTQRETRVAADEDTLKARSAGLDERESAVSKRETAVSMTESELDRRENSLRIESAHVQRKLSAAERRESETALRQSNLFDREEAVKERETRVSKLETALRGALEAVKGVVGAVAERLGLIDGWALEDVVDAAEGALRALDDENDRGFTP